VRLTLSGLSHGDGDSLQEAADDLVRRLLVLAMAFRTSGAGPVTSESVHRPAPTFCDRRE
jgi:hypothetical protein